jgi:UPF0755 protein
VNTFSRRKAYLVFALFLLFTFSLYWFLFRPSSQSSLTKVIYIRKGMPLKKISAMLEEEEVIRNRYVFIGIVTLLGKKTGIKAGEYEFHTQMPPIEVLDILMKGQVKLHLATITEGSTLSQIAQLLEELNIVDRRAFLQKASSPAFISSLGLPVEVGSTLEGYLFPDTYHLFKGMDPEEVIQMMVRRFKKVFNSDLASRASQLGISQKEAVILASIIEKETSLSEEKPLISAVFHNRLKKRMPLQSDPTVIYGIKNFNGNLTKEDLLRPTPYNTYVTYGLPPTPICNPGKDSLHAALYPAPVPYLYFVSKNDGSHYFSSNIEEHNQAVWKYQKYPIKNLTTR